MFIFAVASGFGMLNLVVKELKHRVELRLANGVSICR